MKKNNKPKSPAPATKTAKPAKKKTPGVATPAVAAPVPPPPVAPTPVAPVPTARPVATTVTPKAIASAPVQTKIIARIDVGYGNALCVRGDGPGLSWGQGVTMECVSSDQWELTLGEYARPISFKILLNDMIWCTGPDSVVASGSTATVTPEFA